jgi:hypothetical protein
MDEQNQANRAAAESGFDSDAPPQEGDGEVLETALGLFGQLVQVIQGAQPQTTAPTTAPSSPGVVSGPGPMRVALAPAPYLSPRTISPRTTTPSTYGWDRMTVGIGVALGLLLLGGALALRR